jgi:hypothetical protein
MKVKQKTDKIKEGRGNGPALQYEKNTGVLEYYFMAHLQVGLDQKEPQNLSVRMDTGTPQWNIIEKTGFLSMALFEINRVVDTVIDILESQRPYFDTLTDRYFQDRMLTIYKGRRPSLPASQLPSIEVYPTASTQSWFACRTLQEEMSLGIDVSIDNTNPALAVDLEGKLTTLVVRILTRPPHLRTYIQGTPYTWYDSLPQGVQYGGSSPQGVMRVSRLTWSAKALEHMSHQFFPSRGAINGILV